jgi:hypothetical protein
LIEEAAFAQRRRQAALQRVTRLRRSAGVPVLAAPAIGFPDKAAYRRENKADRRKARMGEILGIGTTHHPSLTGTDEAFAGTWQRIVNASSHSLACFRHRHSRPSLPTTGNRLSI